MPKNSTVYIGTWTNWSRGRLHGSTLTISGQNAAILVVALALFIRFAGTKLWSILCFVAHQVRTTTQPLDGMHHQIQATLRNNGSDAGTTWQIAKVVWTWRVSRPGNFWKSLGLILFGIIHLAVFSAAGLLSFRLTTVQSEVLVRSHYCGPWNINDISQSATKPGIFTQMVANEVHDMENAELTKQYVRDCTTGTQSVTECNTFKVSRLKYSTTSNVPCPFLDGMCLPANNSAVKFDTGLIDSCHDLGINAEMKDRVQFRKTMTCSPIKTQGFLQSGVFTFDGQNYSFAGVSYGPSNLSFDLNTQHLKAGIPFNNPNLTYHLIAPGNALFSNVEAPTNLYSLHVLIDEQSALTNGGTDGFTPITSLEGSDRTLNLVLVTYTGAYTDSSDDPWFPAHQNATFSNELYGENITSVVYVPDNAISVLACTEQHQFCNPNRGPNDVRCTPLLPLGQLLAGATFENETGYFAIVFDNPLQSVTLDAIAFGAVRAQLTDLLSDFNSPPLLASDLNSGQISLPLSADHWKQESDHFFAMSMNHLQRWVTEFATGPPSQYTQYSFGFSSINATTEWICNSQIIRDPNYTCFSILWISLIFGIGGLTILVSLNLERVVGYFQRRYKKGLYQQVRWQLDSTLQLQRMAFEEAGLGVWEGGANDVPTTVDKTQKIQTALEWDEKHPSICGKTSVRRKGTSTRSMTARSMTTRSRTEESSDLVERRTL